MRGKWSFSVENPIPFLSNHEGVVCRWPRGRAGGPDGVQDAIEGVFALFFTVEIIIRFLAFEHKEDCLRDFWFKCDLALAILIYVENAFLILFALR